MINKSTDTTHEYFPGMQDYINKILEPNKPAAKRFSDIFVATINLFELSLTVFIVSTIKTYEGRFTDDDTTHIKKTKPISETLKAKYAAPSLGSQTALAKYCFYLIDNNAPTSLTTMKTKLDEAILLGSISHYLSDLTKIFKLLEDEDDNRPIVVNRENTKKSLLAIINEFVAFRNESSHTVPLAKIIEENESRLRLNIDHWTAAFLMLATNLKPLLSHTYRYKTTDVMYAEKGVKMISIKNKDFLNNSYKESIEKFKLEDWFEDQWTEKTQIIIENGKSSFEIDAFPFLILKDGKLFFYKKTKASGYQYFSIVDDRTFTVKSKAKFNRSVFKTSSAGNSQALFWTEVVPVINPLNKIKSNIPSQGNTQFIGRKKQISKIREEIIEIPNQNGILYGPGGVGKTALLIELSQKLYNETNPEHIYYDNIIWVSAKSNFYHWEQNATISNPQQFESLENIFQIVLRFFDYEDVDEYSNEDLTNILLELLEENKILLVLDNFETVSKGETEKIITFFGSDVKKHLRRLPNNFKVILTSRELLPSGYYQIKLEGLEFKESKQLMESIYWRYKDSHPELSLQQYKLIHESTSGIPIVIKHCLGQVYEFHIPLSDVLEGLSEQSNEVIKFSYSEVLSHLKKDNCYLKILILLEIINEPISARQIALILELQINDINKHLPTLLNFQCVDRINVGIEEKYRLSNQIGLLSKSLIKENLETTTAIRLSIAQNLTIEKRMDYAVEELEVIDIFKGLLEGRDFEYAENFLKAEIKKRQNSHLLRYHYAMFLRDRKKEFNQAIQLLESLDEEVKKYGKRDVNILLALVSTYNLLDFKNFDKSKQLCSDLLKISATDEVRQLAAEFYISWSTTLKNKREIDPIEDMKRKNKIKDLAKSAIQQIDDMSELRNTPHNQYLMSLAYFNLWETNKAKEFISKAISQSHRDVVNLRKYEKFFSMIERY